MLTQTLVLLSHGGTTNAKDSSCPYPLTQMSHFFSHSFPDRPAPPRTLPCLSQPQRPSSDLWSHPTLSQRRILERAGLVGEERAGGQNCQHLGYISWLVFLKSHLRLLCW